MGSRQFLVFVLSLIFKKIFRWYNSPYKRRIPAFTCRWFTNFGPRTRWETSWWWYFWSNIWSRTGVEWKIVPSRTLEYSIDHIRNSKVGKLWDSIFAASESSHYMGNWLMDCWRSKLQIYSNWQIMWKKSDSWSLYLAKENGFWYLQKLLWYNWW